MSTTSATIHFDLDSPTYPNSLLVYVADGDRYVAAINLGPGATVLIGSPEAGDALAEAVTEAATLLRLQAAKP